MGPLRLRRGGLLLSQFRDDTDDREPDDRICGERHEKAPIERNVRWRSTTQRGPRRRRCGGGQERHNRVPLAAYHRPPNLCFSL